ncbi:fused (3R)-hydroxyacyl-ACP dehydratase subunits HadA/HadB [Nocardia sp. NPDC058480]|uniref:fused (3R)-hydroxyacyl-ACP dehydratase subunits HadA/HadB n=1 Tax=Nocardia sp. NPDC058480 TaxID=3346522 RepID=UPI0036554B6C
MRPTPDDSRLLDSSGDSDTSSSLVGQSYRTSDCYVVGREKIREFARAVQDGHPVHQTEEAAADYGYAGLVAPLTFISIPAFLAQIGMFDRVVQGYDLSQIMQTDQCLTVHRPILAGDALRFEVEFESFRKAFGGDLFGFKCSVTDQNGDEVITVRTSFVGRPEVNIAATNICDGLLMQNFRHGTSIPRQRHTPEQPARPRRATAADLGRNMLPFSAIAVGDELPPRSVTVRLGDLVNYAGVAGDPNPIHWNNEAAASVGLESPVAQGMLMIGIGAGYVTSWAGDPGVVTEYAVRLTSPVYVPTGGATVEYTGKVKAVDPDRKTATVAITAKQDDRKIFGRAVAVIQCADR